MVRLKWDNEDSPMYQTGVSQGVFYGDDGVGYAWAGLISVTEKPQTNAPTAVYNAMGQKYDNFGNVAEKKHGLACYTYPEVMDEYLGYEYLEEFGYIADERPPKKFHMAYRVELGDGLYEIHVLLNQIATFGETARQTISNIMSPSTITMNLEGAVDPRIGTSHIRLDSRIPFTKTVEALLFGDEYTDANINSFLAAEPEWETVAVNYAPIIEPDYDNMFWLGNENLLLDSDSIILAANYGSISIENSQIGIIRVVGNGNWQAYGFYHNNISVSPESFYTKGRTYTLSMQLRISSSNDGLVGIRFDARNTEGSVRSVSPTYGDTNGSWVDVETSITLDDDGYNQGLMTIFSENSNPFAIGDLVEYRHIKLEEGSIATAWTPAPSDPNQTPRPSDPRPYNYNPGIKNSSKWMSNNGLIQLFYDEDRKGLGLYSKTTFDSLNEYNDIYWDDITPYVSINTIPGHIIGGRSVYATAKVTMIDPISDLISSRYATLGFGQYGTTADSPPNERGESVLYVLKDTLKVPVGYEYDTIRLYHGGSSDTETVTFTDILIAPHNQEPTFFDVNSNPPQGIRYQRVSTPYGDYTIKQALLLRNK